MPVPSRFYRVLIKLYPARFREEFGEPLERQFWDEYGQAGSAPARAIFLLRAFADLAATIPAEILRELLQDLRYAARVYRRRAFVTTLALAALALAIGASTGVFSVVNARLLRSLPFRSPARLVLVPQLISSLNTATPVGFHTTAQSSPFLEDAASYRPQQMNLNANRRALHVQIAETSQNFFSLLGTAPALGRTFAPGEDVEGRDRVTVISYGLWQQFFGGDPGILGATIRLQGVPLTVVGVAPPAFDFPGNTSLWTPTVFDFALLPAGEKMVRGTVIGRMKPGIGIAAANRIYREGVLAAGGNRRLEPFRLEPLRDQLAGPVRQASFVLLGLVMLVLLIACANVAQLLLSRTSERRTELTLRAALGASRARLVQQLATESAVLTLAAACAGLAVARWTVQLAALALPAQLATQAYTILDWRVLSFALGLSALTGVLFGVVPASLIGRFLVDDALRARGPTPRGIRRMRAVVLAVQAAVAVVLLAGSLTLGSSFLKLLNMDLGYRVDHVATLGISLFGTRYETDYRVPQTVRTLRELPYYRQALDRLRAVPGVESVAAVDFLPLVNDPHLGDHFTLDSGQDGPAMQVAATPDYFRTLSAGIVEGRDFTEADRQGSEPVAIVSQSFARQVSPDASVLGHKVTPDQDQPLTIVGIAADARYDPLRKQFADVQVYTPMAQSPGTAATITVCVKGNPEAYLPILRDSLRQVDPEVPVYGVMTLNQRLRESLARPRFYTTAVLFFAGFALLLAVIGAYGAVSHSIAQRTQEIGVRIAVGASPRGVRAMLLRQSMLPVAAGMLFGIAGAAALGRFLQHLILTAEPAGTTTCAAALVLSATAAAAIWIATGRILRLDPTAALRAE